MTLLYSLGGSGREIANTVSGNTTYQFQDKSVQVAQAADSTGYVAFPPELQQKIAGSCYDGTQQPNAEQMNLLRGIVTQLKQNYYAVPAFFWTVVDEVPKPNCLNSSASAELRTVFFYSVMGEALSWNRDAIASVMAHEVGHIVDKYCTSVGQNITPDFYQTPLGQICEKHADNIGIQLALGAGFNPNGFVATFQTLQRYVPTNTGARYTANHPINQDRILNVGLGLETLCKKNIPGACEYAQQAQGNSSRSAPTANSVPQNSAPPQEVKSEPAQKQAIQEGSTPTPQAQPADTHAKTVLASLKSISPIANGPTTNDPASGAMPDSKPRLTNADIISMVKSGLSSSVIVAKMDASDCAFDTSPTALNQLNLAGVPDAIVVRMIGPTSNPNEQRKDNSTDRSGMSVPTTKVIRYTPPADLRFVGRGGECWQNSIAAPYRADAWRCSERRSKFTPSKEKANSILDPCFSSLGGKFVACGADPIEGHKELLLMLTKPLPKASDQPSQEQYRGWLIQLSDGTACVPFTGERPEVNGQYADYGCIQSSGPSGDALLIGLDGSNPVWTVKVIRSGSKSAKVVTVKAVWQ